MSQVNQIPGLYPMARVGFGAGACPDGTIDDGNGNCVADPNDPNAGGDGSYSATGANIGGQPAGQGTTSSGGGNTTVTPPPAQPNNTSVTVTTTPPTSTTTYLIAGAAVVAAGAVGYALFKHGKRGPRGERGHVSRR